MAPLACSSWPSVLYPSPVTLKRFWPGTVNSRAVILFRVSVPVLSEQMAETEPSVSTDGRRLTMAFWSARTRVPIE